MATGDRRALRHGAKVQIDGYGTVVLDSLDDLPQVKANLDKKFEEVRGFVDTFWGGLSKEDKAAIAVAPVPVLGDAVGLYADAVNYINDPDSRNWLNYTLTLASVLPLVPSATQVRAAKQAKKTLETFHQRAARLKAEGFDTGRVFYHGTAGDFERFDKSKLGASTQAKSAKEGVWMVDDPQTASGYADYAGGDAKVQEILRKADDAEKAGDWDLYDKHLVDAENLEKAQQENYRLYGQSVRPVYSKGQMFDVDMGGAEYTDVTKEIERTIKRAKLEGYSGVNFQNLADDIGLSGRPATHRVVFDPSDVISTISD